MNFFWQLLFDVQTDHLFNIWYQFDPEHHYYPENRSSYFSNSNERY